MKHAKALPRAEQTALKLALSSDFSSKILGRGKDLFAAGKVSPVLQKPGSEGYGTDYRAIVIGSSGKAYDVTLTVEAEYDLVEAECTCPYQYNCKHSVALIFSLLVNGLSVTQEDKVDAGQNPDAWSDAFRATLTPTASIVPPKSWHLVYLLRVTETDVALGFAQRYRKKNGDWGRMQALYPYSIERLHAIGAADREVIAMVEHALPEVDYVARGQMEIYQAEGVLGRQILEWALRSGRALDMDNLEPWQWGSARDLILTWQTAGKGHKLLAQLSPAPDAEWQLYEKLVPPVYRVGATFGSAETALSAEQLALIRRMPAVPAALKEDLTVHLNHAMSDAMDSDEAPSDIELLSEATPIMRLVGVPAAGSGLLPALQLMVRYGDLTYPLEYDEALSNANNPSQEQLLKTDDSYVRLVRDWAAEGAWVSQLRTLGLVPYTYGKDIGERWVPSEVLPAQHVLAWNKLLPGLQQLADDEGWELELDSSYHLDQGVVHISGDATDAGHGWFDLKLNLHIDGTELDTETLLTQWLKANTPDTMAIQGTDNHWRTLDMQPLKPVLGLLYELYQGSGLDKPARLPGFKAMELDGLDDINVKQAPALKKLRKELKNFRGVQRVEPAKYLAAELRDYQQLGLNWLMFLHRYGFGGILADDMGLGKTLQTLAFVQRLKAGRKLTRGALIVAPTSLIWNWQKEAERFTPNLRCLVLHGPERKEQFDAIADHDLVITTYALIHRDFDVYKQFEFDLCVLDEAQNIKNRQAKTTRRVKQLLADMRLCLTGTPLENHLGELWSLADYVLPGLLGDDRYFNAHYRQPIEQRGDTQRAEELSQRVAPFMLRRTKAEVVKELPSKTNILQTVHLEGKQQALYESIRISMEKRVRQLIKSKGLAKSRIEFLDALLKLRQACIDPRLVKLSKAAGIEYSAKMAWLTDNLPEMVEEGRKILLFSQFTTMLDLIDSELNDLGIETVKLTGRTKKRQDAIMAFQEGPVPVFLISLKAGGSGLNLTAADTVIHVDPWWNPAVENQATDRAYRIGQDKPVFVYKLVAAGTVEEKIQAMQQEKQALADALFEQSNKVGLPGSGDELLALFGA
ncbi:MAG: DEAD/DEAH box helicase [Saccharospirillum sp.]|nr:DEAD/DEAH box helicase [Saccharospirillum sp.]